MQFSTTEMNYLGTYYVNTLVSFQFSNKGGLIWKHAFVLSLKESRFQIQLPLSTQTIDTLSWIQNNYDGMILS